MTYWKCVRDITYGRGGCLDCATGRGACVVLITKGNLGIARTPPTLCLYDKTREVLFKQIRLKQPHGTP